MHFTHYINPLKLFYSKLRKYSQICTKIADVLDIKSCKENFINFEELLTIGSQSWLVLQWHLKKFRSSRHSMSEIHAYKRKQFLLLLLEVTTHNHFGFKRALG